MTATQIAELKSEIQLRGLIPELLADVKAVRRNISRDTIYNALNVTNYYQATPLRKLIIDLGKKILHEAKESANKEAPLQPVEAMF